MSGRIIVMLAALCCAGMARAQSEPLPIETGVPQFFVDDFLIESQTDLQRTLHQPSKDNGGNEPVIALDDEFGQTPATLEANGTILFDPKLKKWVMFALGFAPSYEGPSGDRVRLYRFTSDDAMNWIKGDDGTPQRIAIDLHDAQSDTSASNIDLFSCYYDTTDAQHPYKGWLWFANWGELEGIYFMQSSDGRTWKRGPRVMRHNSHVIKQDGRVLSGPSDVTIFYHDAPANRFLASIKFHTYEPVGPRNHLRSRAYEFVDSLSEPLDLTGIEQIALLPAAAAANGDLPHDEYYGSTAWRYGSLWLGGLKIWHGGGDYPYSAAGCAFLKLAVSRDGLSWEKVPFVNDAGQPEVFIPNGVEGGNGEPKGARNDGGYMTEFSNPPLRIGDELIHYYGASSWGKNQPRDRRVTGGGIFRARLRPDGFVSVDSGTLTTRTLEFDGSDLNINAIGRVDIALCDADGKPLAQTRVEGDSLRHNVRFDGKSLRDLAPDGVAKLKFSVKPGGRLYSFTVVAPR